jgi:Xaa-Pro aminopeptidase
LESVLKEAVQKGRPIHFLPPYRTESQMKLLAWLGIPPQEAKSKSSPEFIKAVVAQRSVKSEEEIAQIEIALKTSFKMYITAMHMAQPGIYEKDIAGRIDGIAMADGGATAFPTILTINGQILHNHDHANLLKKGRLLVVDAGAESPLHYASDITRTIPVGGKFSAKQKEIYEIVLAGQESAIKGIKPRIMYKDVHLQTAKVIASGLKSAGLMKGDVEEAVRQGAHALFFPHGLGHMLGLDVHDMENLGEGYVGYDHTVKRSDQFGLAYLRMAKELRPNYILTVEPGIYFIPALIDLWKKENKCLPFISRVLGRPIPKKAAQVEQVATL